jgi:hypothetical protein
MWQSKDKMVMPYRQGGLQQFLYPKGLLCCLTFGAMPVSTAIVTVSNHPAAIADLLVPAKSSCPANSYFAQYFDLQRCQSLSFDKLRAKESDHMGQFKRGPHLEE